MCGALVLTALSASCTPANQNVQLQNPTPDAPALDWRRDDDLLAVRMRGLASGLSATGYAPSGFARRGFLSSGARATYELTAPRGRCLTVVALGAAGVNDLDAGIFEADGRAVAQDAASDARPILRACARDAARRLYYVLHAYQGNGAFLVVAFEGPPSADPSGDQQMVADSDATSHSDWTAALVRRGFEPEGAPVELELVPDAPVFVSLPARQDQCLALVAFALDADADVQLTLTDEAGVEQVRDAGDKAWAGVQLCPERSGAYAAEIRVRGTATRVQVGRFTGRSSYVGGQRAMWLGDPPPAASARAAAAPAVAPGGSRRDAGEARGTLVSGAADEKRLRIPPGPCAEIKPVLGKGLERVLVRVVGEKRQSLREAERRASDPGLHVCGAGRKHLPVQIEARRGSGSYSLTALRAESDAVERVQHAPQGAREQLLDLLALAKRRGWTGATELVVLPPDAWRCDQGGGCVLRRELQLAPDACLSAAVVSASGRSEALTIAAEGQPDSGARQGLATRCRHDGAVTLSVRRRTRPEGVHALLRVVHEREPAAPALTTAEQL